MLVLFIDFALAQGRSGSSSGSGSSSKGGRRSSSYEGLFVEASIFYGETKSRAQTSAGLSADVDLRSIVNTVRLGKITSAGLYLGALYAEKTDTTHVFSRKAQGYGLGLGWFLNNGIYLRGFYRFNETYGDYGDGVGYTAEFGFYLKMSARLRIGFMLNYNEISFLSNSTISNYKTWTSRASYPALTLGYLY